MYVCMYITGANDEIEAMGLDIEYVSVSNLLEF